MSQTPRPTGKRGDPEPVPARDDAARPSVHVSIDVPDLEAGARFYGAVFGFVETARPFPTMAIFDGNNVTVCVHEKKAGTKPSPSTTDTRRYARHWTPVHIDFHVVDFDGVLAKVRSHGGQIEMEFRDQGPKPAAFCADPFGNGFCVIGERAREARDAGFDQSPAKPPATERPEAAGRASKTPPP